MAERTRLDSVEVVLPGTHDTASAVAAGELLGGILDAEPERLGRFLALVVTLVLAFFTPLTGASGITILALGGLLLPMLRAGRYSERRALGLVTVSGSIGVLFPPSLPVILYAYYAELSKGQLQQSLDYWLGVWVDNHPFNTDKIKEAKKELSKLMGSG